MSKIIEKNMEPVRPSGEIDAVKMMRKIRDNISSKTQDMTFQELKAYIKLHIEKSKLDPISK